MSVLAFSPARLLCLLSSVEYRNSPEFRLKPKQSEAFSAASLPAGPEAPCFTRYYLVNRLGMSFFWSPPKPTASRFSFPSLLLFLLVGSCSLLSALSPSPYDAPTPPSDEANLERGGTRSLLWRVVGNGRQGRGAACSPASQPKQKQSRKQKTFLEFWFIGSAGSG